MSTSKERLANYPDVSFIDDLTFEELQESMLEKYCEKYEEETGEKISLAAADPMRLTLYSCATVLYQAYQMCDRAGKRGLLKYSDGNFLDLLGAFKKVTRNPAQSAKTTLLFTLSSAQSETIKIPKGTRVRTEELFFETEKVLEIMTGEVSAGVSAICQTPGASGNGILAGTIKTLVDPVNYVKNVTNLTETSEGADEESDEDLAERIYLAPSGYSTAGPSAAYEYWVRTYSQNIEDCYIGNNAPGEVDIYITHEGGKLPEQSFLDGLKEHLSSGDRRPLTDKVIVLPPEVTEYDIDATYYIAESDENMEETIKEKVEKARDEYINWQKEKIGRDINPSYLTHLLIKAGAKWVNIRGPAFRAVQECAIAVAAGINLEYGGVQDD